MMGNLVSSRIATPARARTGETAAPVPLVARGPAIRHSLADFRIEAGGEQRRAASYSRAVVFPVSAPRWTPAAAQPPVQMKRDRSQIRHGDREKELSEARWRLHESWKVPSAYRHQPIVGLPRAVLGPPDATHAQQLANLPERYRSHPDVRRLLLGEQDPAHKKVQKITGPAKAQSSKDSGGRLREVLAAIEFAEQHKVPSSEVSSAKKDYDFDVGRRKIDPFEMPRGGFSAKPSEKDDEYFGLDGAYVKHNTPGGKGGATGVLDTTYSHPEDVQRMFRRRDSLGAGADLNEPVQVRVPLEREYLRDALKGNQRFHQIDHHRGSDPTRKFGPTDFGRMAANKARYDARMKKKRGG